MSAGNPSLFIPGYRLCFQGNVNLLVKKCVILQEPKVKKPGPHSKVRLKSAYGSNQATGSWSHRNLTYVHLHSSPSTGILRTHNVISSQMA